MLESYDVVTSHISLLVYAIHADFLRGPTHVSMHGWYSYALGVSLNLRVLLSRLLKGPTKLDGYSTDPGGEPRPIEVVTLFFHYGFNFNS